DVYKRQSLSSPPATSDLWIASVVPRQTQLWQGYPQAQFMTLDQIPLAGIYPTLGIDRALAVWGAIATIGSPVLVIDAGTALTLTGANAQQRLIGGAILPGLQLQFQSLGQSTAALPVVDWQDAIVLPSRWATSTPEAIASGILHTVLAGLQNFINIWWEEFPATPVVFTGGDGDRLYRYLLTQMPDWAAKLTVDPNLIFWGMRAVRLG
ncbi:pantothenate kinase, partial [Pantanalinema rosaneae CENA516]|uniref:pantothenate kinase n=1 Tax=Pantanalinema rosaneae TaxID=1620701 RepID=UPI003D6E3499